MTSKKNAAQVAAQAEPCPKNMREPEKSTSVEWEVLDKAPLAGTLNEMVEMMVRQVETPNGAPLFLFMPMVNAVLAKQRRLNELREQQAGAIARNGGAV